MNIFNMFKKIGKIKIQENAKERKYYINTNESIFSFSMLFKDGKWIIDDRCTQLYEDKNGLYFILIQTDKQFKEYQESAEILMKLYGEPLNSYRCYKCKRLHPITMIGGNTFLHTAPEKWDVQLLCRKCYKNY